MTGLCIPKSMRGGIAYLLLNNRDEHSFMASERWHEAHERLVKNSGLDIKKWQDAKGIEYREHQKAVEFIYSIPVCGEQYAQALHPMPIP